jgi:2-hydroxy-3-oxopropionate reductase
MQLAVIGVGVMGSAIAGRLLGRGITLHLYDRDPAQMATLVARGAIAAASAREATANADHVIISLNSAAIVEQAVFGLDGVAQGADATKLLIDMSSIDAGRTATMAQRLR